MKVVLSRDAEHGRQSLESESVRVLNEHHPLFSVFQPLLGNTASVKKRMNVTVTMRLSHDRVLSLIKHKVAVVVHQGWHILLLDNIDVGRVQAKVVICLEKLDSLVMRVIGDHDTERDVERRQFLGGKIFTNAIFTRLDVPRIVFEIAVVVEEG